MSREYRVATCGGREVKRVLMEGVRAHGRFVANSRALDRLNLGADEPQRPPAL